VLSRAPSPLTIAGPEEVVIISYLSVEDATASEQDDATIDFVVTLSPASDEPVTVDYATANGTAVAGGDYRAKSGTLTFAAGQTSRTVRVSVIDDDLEEDQETLHLNLTNPSGGDHQRSPGDRNHRRDRARKADGPVYQHARYPRRGQQLRLRNRVQLRR
jgi:hypothetical protein